VFALSFQPLALNVHVMFCCCSAGAQISWRTVFLVEYFGPILIHSLFYFFPEVFYGQQIPDSKRHYVAK